MSGTVDTYPLFLNMCRYLLLYYHIKLIHNNNYITDSSWIQCDVNKRSFVTTTTNNNHYPPETLFFPLPKMFTCTQQQVVNTRGRQVR